MNAFRVKLWQPSCEIGSVQLYFVRLVLISPLATNQGIDAEFVSLENVVAALDDNNAEPRSDSGSLDQSFYDRVAVAVGQRIKQCGQRVPVITG